MEKTANSDIFAVSAEGNGAKIGMVKFVEKGNGLQISVNLQNLPAGEHGFHIHENASCAPATDANGKVQAALAAGGHFDPDKTRAHKGPHGHGHRGDLPLLNVAADGTVKTEFFIENLTVDEIKNRSLVIHAGGDNYQDEPLPLGGGGARIACGIIR